MIFCKRDENITAHHEAETSFKSFSFDYARADFAPIILSIAPASDGSKGPFLIQKVVELHLSLTELKMNLKKRNSLAKCLILYYVVQLNTNSYSEGHHR